MKGVRFYLVVVCLVAGCIRVIAAHLDGNGQDAVYRIPWHIQYPETLQNKTNKVVKDSQFQPHEPVKPSPVQRCTKSEDSHPYELITGDPGNQVSYFTRAVLYSFAQKTLTTSAGFFACEDANKSSVNEAKMYLRRADYAESRHPDSVRTAKDLRGPGEEMRKS